MQWYHWYILILIHFELGGIDNPFELQVPRFSPRITSLLLSRHLNQGDHRHRLVLSNPNILRLYLLHRGLCHAGNRHSLDGGVIDLSRLRLPWRGTSDLIDNLPSWHSW